MSQSMEEPLCDPVLAFVYGLGNMGPGGGSEDEISPIAWLGSHTLTLILLSDWPLGQKGPSLELAPGGVWLRMDQKQGISCDCSEK